MDIITGYRGEAHVTSADIQALNLGLVGGGVGELSGGYVQILETGSRLAATIASNTSVTIADGVGLCDGVAFRILPGTTESVQISAGTAGYYRGDYICVHYTKNTSTGVESVELAVLEGTPSTTGARYPDTSNDSIYEGATDAYFVLYQVYIEGTTLVSVRPVHDYDIIRPLRFSRRLNDYIDNLYSRVNPMTTAVQNLTNAVGSLYQMQAAVAGGATGEINMSGAGTGTYRAYLVTATYNSTGSTYDYVGLLFLNTSAGTTHILDIAKGSASNVVFSATGTGRISIQNNVSIYCRASVLQIYG